MKTKLLMGLMLITILVQNAVLFNQRKSIQLWKSAAEEWKQSGTTIQSTIDDILKTEKERRVVAFETGVSIGCRIAMKFIDESLSLIAKGKLLDREKLATNFTGRFMEQAWLIYTNSDAANNLTVGGVPGGNN